MGITGLIPFLEKASSKIQLKDLRGSTVAIDSYCWLHKGVFSCAEKLARGEETDQYINYCLKYVQMLLSFDIKPILVFDGMHLPAKALTEKRRRESRRESKKRAAELLRLGKTEEARSHMRRCIDVTHEMALRLIREMRLRNVDCIVAPYEADAQMAWLNKAGIAQYVITEDSDLTLFGATKIIFKLDLSGTGLLVESEKLHLTMGCSKERYKFDKFRRMCILSGCDYLDSLHGIGLAKACKFMLKTEQEDMWIALKKIPIYLNMKQLQVDDEYIDNFLKAEATFKHMYIYNPLKRKMERLHDLSEFGTAEQYCSNAGKPLDDDEMALNLALGNLNPFTFKQLDTWHPDRDFGLAQAPSKHIKRAKHKSIWQPAFTNNIPSKSKQLNENGKSCALYFKKVDFVSATIEQEINASLNEENAKPAEADVFQIYRNETNEPNSKRPRYDNCGTGFGSIQASPSSKRHNPFAKTHKNEDDASSSSNSPLICANSSLIKVLSPQKFKQETQRVNSFKRRSIENKIEVRSRFFSDNIKLVNSEVQTSKTSSITAIDLAVSNEIETMERLSQQQAKNQALLYNSPSPVKSERSANEKQFRLSHTDSGIESLNSVEHDLDIDLGNTPAESTEISDEEDNVQNKDCSKNVTATSNERKLSSIQLDTFKSRKIPRIGLSKPKSKYQKTKNVCDLKQNQTRLSMFGFQKRPILK